MNFAVSINIYAESALGYFGYNTVLPSASKEFLDIWLGVRLGTKLNYRFSVFGVILTARSL